MFILSYYNTFFTKKTTDCSLYVGFIARLVFCIWLRRTKRHGKNALTKQQRKSTHPSRQSLRFVQRHLPCQGKAFYMENNPLSRLSATAPLTKGSLYFGIDSSTSLGMTMQRATSLGMTMQWVPSLGMTVKPNGLDTSKTDKRRFIKCSNTRRRRNEQDAERGCARRGVY